MVSSSLARPEDPDWLTLAELSRQLHKRSDEWRRLGEQRALAREALLNCQGTPADKAAYELEIATIRQTAQIVSKRICAGIKAEATQQKIIGFGRTRPDADEELIKPHYWNFLEFEDAEGNVVSGPGLHFAGVRFAVWGDLSLAWQERIAELLGRDGGHSTPSARSVRRKSEPAYSLMLRAKRDLVRSGEIIHGMAEGKQYDLVLKHLGKRGDERGFGLDNYAKRVADDWDDGPI